MLLKNPVGNPEGFKLAMGQTTPVIKNFPKLSPASLYERCHSRTYSNKQLFRNLISLRVIQSDQKVSVYLMIVL